MEGAAILGRKKSWNALSIGSLHLSCFLPKRLDFHNRDQSCPSQKGLDSYTRESPEIQLRGFLPLHRGPSFLPCSSQSKKPNIRVDKSSLAVVGARI